MSDPTRETVASVLDLLLGDANGENGRLTSAVREQIMPQIEARVKPMEESIQTLRESLATGPPSKETRKYEGPPWNAAAAALGIPDASWYNPEAVGAELDGKFDSFGDYLKAVINKGRSGIKDDRLVNIGMNGDKAALSGEEIQLGGALVPEEFRPVLMSGMLNGGNIRPRAMTIPMGSGSIKVPAIRDGDHSDGTVFGGIRFTWTEQSKTITESAPDFKLIELNARTLSGRTPLPNELLEDSFVTVPMLLMNLWQQAVPWVEDGVFIRGDGAGKPKGVLNAPAAVKEGRAAASKVSVQDIANMESHLLPGSEGRAVWVMHPSAKAQIMTLTNGSVQAWHARLSESMPDTLNGRPIIYSEHCSGLGTEGDVMLIDWMYYLIGDRQALSMAASAHEKFSDYITVVRGIERIDGAPWIDTPVTSAQGSHSMSAFVVLM